MITRSRRPVVPPRGRPAQSLGARPRIRRAVDEALEPRGIGGPHRSRSLGLAPDAGGPARSSRSTRARSPRWCDRVRADRDTAARPAGLEIGEDDITVVPGTPGFGIDPAALRARIAGRSPSRSTSRPVRPASTGDRRGGGGGPRAGAGADRPADLGDPAGAWGPDRDAGAAGRAARVARATRSAGLPRPGHPLRRHRLGLQHPRAAGAGRGLPDLGIVRAARPLADRPQPRHAGDRAGDRRRRPARPRCGPASR